VENLFTMTIRDARRTAKAFRTSQRASAASTVTFRLPRLAHSSRPLLASIHFRGDSSGLLIDSSYKVQMTSVKSDYILCIYPN